jgi:hypothetical protein
VGETAIARPQVSLPANDTLPAQESEGGWLDCFVASPSFRAPFLTAVFLVAFFVAFFAVLFAALALAGGFFSGFSGDSGAGVSFVIVMTAGELADGVGVSMGT